MWNDEPAKSADAPDEEVKTCQWPTEERCSLTRQRTSTTLSLSHLKMAEQEPSDEMHWVLDQARAECGAQRLI